jgi:hypothetical protein
MRRIAILSTGLIAVLAATVAVAAPKRATGGGTVGMLPQDGSLVGLHELRRERNLVCMSDHTHQGSSTGQPTKKAAEVAAQRAWSSFTALEYGDHWGNPALAGSRTMKCNGGGSSYNCDFEARPCRR